MKKLILIILFSYSIIFPAYSLDLFNFSKKEEEKRVKPPIFKKTPLDLKFDKTTKNYKSWENHNKYGSSTAEIDKAFLKRYKSTYTKFFLYSPDMSDNSEVLENQLYNKSGCSGKNNSPKLIWKNSPKNTESFAITIFDKDANIGSGWWHWIIYNIPSDIDRIEMGANNKGKLPKKSKQNMNDFGEKKYSGICPQDDKKHTYIITIYAIDIKKLEIPRSATPAMANLIIKQHSLGTATITSFYQTEAGKEKDKKLKAKKNNKKTLKSNKKKLKSNKKGK